MQYLLHLLMGFSRGYFWKGAYDDEEAAAHAYDLAALKYWGQETILNFPVIYFSHNNNRAKFINVEIWYIFIFWRSQLTTYQKEVKEMEGQSREEYIGSLRRLDWSFQKRVEEIQF